MARLLDDEPAEVQQDLGFTHCHTCGFVGQSYNLENTAERIINVRQGATA